jgi:hypothetical protein
VLIVLLAVAAALLPPPASITERVFSQGWYPRQQAALTSLSNLVPFALFDLVIAGGAGALLVAWWRWGRLAWRQRSPRAIGRGVWATLVVAAIAFLWFLAAWGFNYRREPLEQSIGFDASRVTPLAVRELAERAIDAANRTHEAGHAEGFPGLDAAPASLAASLAAVERRLGRPRPIVPAHPKRSLLGPYFRAAGVSGMLAPFFLETLLNPDLTGPERPYVLAHEWAHLAGHAPEDDASYVGFLAALGAGPSARYSAWLFLVSEATDQLQPLTRQLVLARLADGPRRDQAAINERLRALVKPVERASWAAYDRALKSQGVEEGVRSYSRVVQLIIGSAPRELTP